MAFAAFAVGSGEETRRMHVVCLEDLVPADDDLLRIEAQPAAKHPAAEHARERMRTPTGRDAAFDRQAHAEGAIAELKRHGADRARCRGTRLLQLQLLAAATAINLKRLLKADDATASGQTGDPATRAATILTLIAVLTTTLYEIGRLAAPDGSTGS
jgi:hypothetical protein